MLLPPRTGNQHRPLRLLPARDGLRLILFSSKATPFQFASLFTASSTTNLLSSRQQNLTLVTASHDETNDTHDPRKQISTPVQARAAPLCPLAML